MYECVCACVHKCLHFILQQVLIRIIEEYEKCMFSEATGILGFFAFFHYIFSLKFKQENHIAVVKIKPLR